METLVGKERREHLNINGMTGARWWEKGERQESKVSQRRREDNLSGKERNRNVIAVRSLISGQRGTFAKTRRRHKSRYLLVVRLVLIS